MVSSWTAGGMMIGIILSVAIGAWLFEWNSVTSEGTSERHIVDPESLHKSIREEHSAFRMGGVDLDNGGDFLERQPEVEPTQTKTDPSQPHAATSTANRSKQTERIEESKKLGLTSLAEASTSKVGRLQEEIARCRSWNCTCQGISNTYGTKDKAWGSAADKDTRRWWIEHKCNTAPCSEWNCTCQGFSDKFGTKPGSWNNARDPVTKAWWLNEKCQTLPKQENSVKHSLLEPVAQRASIAPDRSSIIQRNRMVRQRWKN